MKVIYLKADISTTKTNIYSKMKMIPMKHTKRTAQAIPGPNAMATKAFRKPNIIAAGDSDNSSVRKAMSSFATAAQDFGHNLDDFALSPATIHQTRKIRKKRVAFFL